MPLNFNDIYGEDQGLDHSQSFNQKFYEEKISNVRLENQNVLDEIEKQLKKFEENENQSENSSSISLQTQSIINDSFPNKILEKAKTLEKEMRMQRNKKLVSALENVPTQRAKIKSTSKSKNQKAKPQKPKEKNPKVNKPKEIKFRPIK